jgi:hypothetical protein
MVYKISRGGGSVMKFLAAANALSSILVCWVAQRITVTGVLLIACAGVEYTFALVQEKSERRVELGVV